MENKKNLNSKLITKEIRFSIYDLIADSMTNLISLARFSEKGFKIVKENIQSSKELGKLVPLEEYIGKTTEELNKEYPGVCDIYNRLVKEIQNPDLTFIKFSLIMDEANTLFKDVLKNYKK